VSLKTLAEAVIIQSAEDIMDKHQQIEAVEFFSGEGFRICSWMAGMDHSAQHIILNLIRRHVATSKLFRQYDNGFNPGTAEVTHVRKDSLSPNTDRGITTSLSRYVWNGGARYDYAA
jgi:hypothetical protein